MPQMRVAMTFHSNSELYNKYDKTVRAVVNTLLLSRRLVSLPIDRDDLYQVGWVALIQCLPHFDETRGVKFETYASRVIVNAVNREIGLHLARRMAHTHTDIAGEDCWVDERSRMMAELIDVVGDKLSVREREVFWKRFIDDKTFEEIGVEKGFSRETARKIYHHSLEKIKEAVA